MKTISGSILPNLQTISDTLNQAEEKFEQYIMGNRVEFLEGVLQEMKSPQKIEEILKDLTNIILDEIEVSKNRANISGKNIYTCLYNENKVDINICDIFLYDFTHIIELLADFFRYETANYYFIGEERITKACYIEPEKKIKDFLQKMIEFFESALKFLNKNSAQAVEHFFQSKKIRKDEFLIISRIRVISYILRIYLKYIQVKMNPRYLVIMDEYDYILNDCNKIFNILERDFHFSKIQYGKKEQYEKLLQLDKLRRICFASIVANIIQGYVYYNIGNNSRSEDAFLKASDLSLKISDVTKIDTIPFDIAKAKLMLGKIFVDKGFFLDALCWYLESFHDFLEVFSDIPAINDLREKIGTIMTSSNLNVEKHNDLINKGLVKSILSNIDIDKLELLPKDCVTKDWAKGYISDLLSRAGFVFYILLGTDNRKVLEILDKWYSTASKLSSANLLAVQNLAVIQGAIDSKKLGVALRSKRIEPSRKINLSTLFNLNVKIDTENYDALEGDILRSMLTNLENIVTTPQKFNKKILIEKKIGGKSHNNINKLLCLRRWNSFTPAIPRATDFNKLAGGVYSYNSNKCPGGGYFLIWNNKGIVIDPGFDFIRNLYSAGYSISDIDAIIVTHAHIDHMGDFFTLLTLIYERKDLLERLYGEKNDRFNKIDLFLNIGTMNSFVSWVASQTKDTIRYIHTLPRKSDTENLDNFFLELPTDEYNMKIEITKAAHNEIYTEDWAIGLKFYLPIDGRKQPVILGITSDTTYDENIIEQYKNCDLLAVHLGDINYKELISFANIEMRKQFIKQIVEGITDDVHLAYLKELAVSLGVAESRLSELNKPEETEEIVKLIFKHEEEFRLENHLGFKGALQLANQLIANTSDYQKIFVFTEFPEYLGSFRKRIAGHFNKRLCSKNKKIFFTGDLGLQVEIDQYAKDPKQIFRILCNKCARDNDVPLADSFHSTDDCQETCVKAADESIVYYCKKHAADPENYFINKVTQ